MLLATIIFWGLLWGCLCLLLCARGLTSAPRLIAAAALACGMRASAVLLPLWLGKGLSVLLSLFIIYGLHWVTPPEAGLQRVVPKSSKVVALVVVLVAAGLFIDAVVSRYSFRVLTGSEKLYYALMPGLEEELFYRGVLLGILSRAFPRVVPLPGTYTSWGGVVGVVLFILGHGLKFPVRLFELGHGTELWQYMGAWLSPAHFPLHTVVYHLAMGTLFLWVRERTNSCWAAVGTHCLLNSCLVAGHAWE